MYELGLTNIDTADGYGDSEDLIGKWFQRSGKRDDVCPQISYEETVPWHLLTVLVREDIPSHQVLRL